MRVLISNDRLVLSQTALRRLRELDVPWAAHDGSYAPVTLHASVPRHDPLLLQVFDELGGKDMAFREGRFQHHREFSCVEIPNGVSYRIVSRRVGGEYAWEIVEETHRVWTSPPDNPSDLVHVHAGPFGKPGLTPEMLAPYIDGSNKLPPSLASAILVLADRLELAGHRTQLAKEKPSQFRIQDSEGYDLVTISLIDGSVELSPVTSTSEAAQAFWKAVYFVRNLITGYGDLVLRGPPGIPGGDCVIIPGTATGGEGDVVFHAGDSCEDSCDRKTAIGPFWIPPVTLGSEP